MKASVTMFITLCIRLHIHFSDAAVMFSIVRTETNEKERWKTNHTLNIKKHYKLFASKHKFDIYKNLFH